MNPSPNNGVLPSEARFDAAESAEKTLRLIASLPAPEGLADRVQAGLQAAPPTGRVLSWRGPLRPAGGGWMHNGWMHSGWMHNDWMHTSVARGVAAAAIVCVVAGGGWRIYSRVQPAPAANVIVMPSRVGPSAGGFSQAGAKRVPQTLQGPVLTHPVADTPEQKVVDTMPASPKLVPGAVTAKRKKAVSRIAVAPVQ